MGGTGRVQPTSWATPGGNLAVTQVTGAETGSLGTICQAFWGVVVVVGGELQRP